MSSSDDFNADDLKSKNKQKEETMNKCFDVIVHRCYKRIKYAHKLGHVSCNYTVPEFIPGFPVYDIKVCILYVMNKLRDKKFFVEYNKPRLLSISWKE